MISTLSQKVKPHFKTILYTGLFSLALTSTSNAARVNISHWQHCGKTVDIKTHHNSFNNHYLNATTDLSKLSVKTGTSSTTKFTIQCFSGDNKIAFKTSQNRFVAAISGDAIKADRTRVGNWEKFEVHTGNSGGRFAFKSYHGKYMVAEPDRKVLADRTRVGNYESFIIETSNNTGDNTGGTNPDYLNFSKVTGLNNGNLGVEVKYANSANNSPLELFIKKANEGDSAYRLVRREGGAPYEWGTLNAENSDSRIQNLSNGRYTLRAVSDRKVNGVNIAKAVSYDVTESDGGNTGDGGGSVGIIDASVGYARKVGGNYPTYKSTGQIGNAVYDNGLSTSSLCFKVNGTKVCASDFKHSVKSSAGGESGDKAIERKFSIPKKSGADYSLVAVSGGGPHFNRNNERTRVRIDSPSNCHIIGHRGGDDKSLYLIKRKNGSSCNFTSDGATQFMNISASGKKLKLMCGNTLDPMYGDKPTAYSPRLASDEMAIFGGDDPERSASRIEHLNKAINPDESSRKAMFFPENQKYSFDDHIIFTRGNPDGLYGSNGMRRNGAFLILKVGSEEGDTGKVTHDSYGHNKCGNKIN